MSIKLASTANSARTELSARLRRAMCSLGLTQSEAGRRVGVDARQVRRWLNGSASIATLDLVLKLEDEQARKVA